jgi:serine/threonine-protein kinase
MTIQQGERRATLLAPTSLRDMAPHTASATGVASLSLPFVMPFEPGELIAGKYRVESLIGTGAVGFVVAATHVGLHEGVALKFLKPELATHQEAVARFTLEARASFKIKNEHVARVFDVDALADGTPFIVMELLEGRDLRSILEAHHHLPIDLAVDLMLQACEALAAAHACQIVHRDIKPENLFVISAGRDDHIKVLDFGISKVALTQSSVAGDSRAAALTMMAIGTPPYMSPEQVRASPSLDARADIWSLGCVLYELLTGATAFEGRSRMQVCAEILEREPRPLVEGCPEAPSELAAVVMRCLRKDPAERYLNVAELAFALSPFAARSADCVERCVELLAGGLRRCEPVGRLPDPSLRKSDTRRKRPSTPAGTALSREALPQELAPLPPLAPLDGAPVRATRSRASRWVLLGIAALHVLSITYVLVRYLDRGGEAGATASDTRTPAELARRVPHVPAIRPVPASRPGPDTQPVDEAPPAEPAAADGVDAPEAAAPLAPSAVSPGSARRAARRAAAAAAVSDRPAEPDVGY